MAPSPRKRAQQSPADEQPVKKRKKARFSELVHVSHDEDEISSSDDDEDRSTHRAGSHHSNATDNLGQATPTSSAFEAMFPVDLGHLMAAPTPAHPSHHTLELEQRLSQVIDSSQQHEASTDSVLRAFMSEVKDQLYQISLRLDGLENVRGGHHLVRVRSHPSEADDDNRSVSESVNANQAAGLGVYLQNTLAGIAAAGPASEHDTEALRAIAALSSGGGGRNGASPAPSVATSTASAPSKRGGRLANRNAAKSEEADTSASKKPTRSRKPELSKVVRIKISEMMGLFAPVPSVGTSKSAKSQNVISGVTLPDFTPNELRDPLTGRRLWRWEWDKTIRQSQFNTKFSQEICEVITREHEQGQHEEVPDEDWPSLPDAVDTAYSNLRRERLSQLDPAKKEKKEVHVKRGKKRQMKVEKSKRRRRALADTHIGELDLSDPQTREQYPWMSAIVQAHEAGYDLEASLDLAFMSSEEDDDQPVSSSRSPSVAPGPVPSSSTPQGPSTERAFTVHRPAWRSNLYASVLDQLDHVKVPERAFKRIIGPPREGAVPPKKAAEWMISADWKAEQAREAAEGVPSDLIDPDL